MATRKSKFTKPDSQGQYARQIGWKLNASGKRVQHKFRLGTDSVEAERRDTRLRELWERIEAADRSSALWSEATLEIAKQLAKGELVIRLKQMEGETDADYAARIRADQQRFQTFRVLPSDEAAFTLGVGASLTSLSECLMWPETAQQQWIRTHKEQWMAPLLPELSPLLPETQIKSSSQALEKEQTKQVSSSATLHEAMRAYIVHIEQTYFDSQLGRITDNGSTKISRTRKLIERHEDVSVDTLDFAALSSMFRYWRQRPFKRVRGNTKEVRISRVSAENYVGELKRFLKWLHLCPDFSWRKPEDFDAIEVKVAHDPVEAQNRLVQAPVFTLAELQLLYRYAPPLERLMLLLGLNCGFGVKEIATLTTSELFLRQAHTPEHQELLGFESTNSDSFLKRVRRKSVVYGEFILFPHTVAGLQWALSRRNKQTGASLGDRLLLNSRNKPFDEPTGNGNRNQQLDNKFGKLKRRIQDDGHSINNLSFGKLRKTGGDLIRRLSDGETAGVFLCHGSPVKTDSLSDVYTNRPFGRVFRAIRKVEAHLAPMFAEAGSSPF